MLVSDPIFSIREASGQIRQVGLFELLASSFSGKLVDLPGMAAHQRPAVVTVLAVIGHVLNRYAPSTDLCSPQAIATSWDALFGADTLRLAAPDNAVAFLQPPTNPTTSRQSIESADLMLPAVEHEVKRTWDTTPERALFAIMGSMMRPNVKDHRTATRIGLSCVLTSSDGSLAGEVINLAEAYDRLFSTEAGKSSASDHMVWLRPYSRDDTPIPLADLPKPFIDIGRAQRLRMRDDGGVEIWAHPNNTIRVDGGPDPWLDDPHTPQRTDAKTSTRYKLAAKDFGYVFESRMLFGGKSKEELYTRPRIMDLTSYKFARVCALGTDQGKTRGYRETLYRTTRSEGLFSLDEPAPEDRPARLSENLIRTLSEGEKSLWFALASIRRTGERGDATSDKIGNQGKDVFRSSVTYSAIDLLFDLLASGRDDPAADQSKLNGLVATKLREAFAIAVPATVEPLASARAEKQLESAIRRKFPVISKDAASGPSGGGTGETRMADASEHDNRPALAKQSFAILSEVAKHLTPNDRAGLRTMSLASPPLPFWKLIAKAPEEQEENPRCINIWKPVLRTLGRVNQSGAPLGRILERTGFPEDRVSRILAGTGASLPGLIDEVGRWLVSHDVEHADLSILATLGLADALGDFEAREWARRRLAIDYVKFRPSAERSANAPDDDGDDAGEEAA
jgi:hypothetical protein